jgi:NSS family neurotransmitter:Na+ symporter
MRALNGKRSFWNFLGWLGVFSALLILSYYIVVLGWTLSYFLKALSGQLIVSSSVEAGRRFTEYVSTPELVALHTAVVLSILALVVAIGLRKGIEKTCRLLLPILFLFLLVLAVRSLSFEGALEGLSWYLTPRFSVLNGTIVLAAMGQAFYSIGVGMAAAFAYGSYLDPETSDVPGNALLIVVLDMSAAFLAGLVIFPALFAFGLSPDAGASLLFVTMSRLFAEVPAGNLLGGSFYFLILLAGITSGIGLLEAVTASIMDLRKIGRRVATLLAVMIAALLSLPAILSSGPWSTIRFWEKDLFQLVDFISGNITLPLGAFLLAIYLAFVWGFRQFRSDANVGSRQIKVSRWWKPAIYFLLPSSLTLILLKGWGVI